MAKYSYACLMISCEYSRWQDIIKMIEPDDLTGKGLEPDAHVTLLYGFHDEVLSVDVLRVIRNILTAPVTLMFTGISHFENDEFDVVKFDVDCPELHLVHDAIKGLPNSESYPDYHPHVTLAYVKTGCGAKYDKKFEHPIPFIGTKVVYSTKDKAKTEWDILGYGALPKLEDFIKI